MDEEEVGDKFGEVIKKYNIDIKKLEDEQVKLAKNLSIKDSIDFNSAERIAGIENIFFGNQIVSAIVVLNEGEIVEQEYFQDKVRFPYLPGFRAYRELPAMMSVFNLLDEKPDIVFVRAHGIIHPRGFGLASHFSLVSGVPAIGIADSLIVGEVEDGNIIINGKILGKMLITKEGARPLYVSPGNMISVDSAVNLTKKCIREPHKIPEPLRLAKKYAREIGDELFKF